MKGKQACDCEWCGEAFCSPGSWRRHESALEKLFTCICAVVKKPFTSLFPLTTWKESRWRETLHICRRSLIIFSYHHILSQTWKTLRLRSFQTRICELFIIIPIALTRMSMGRIPVEGKPVWTPLGSTKRWGKNLIGSVDLLERDVQGFIWHTWKQNTPDENLCCWKHCKSRTVVNIGKVLWNLFIFNLINVSIMKDWT